ncbi:metal ABC transporter permease [Halogeometricum sp. CBA1124]|uniref:metal ABC transporter permease n=1 Tax=Halogeometricum sp. CBA1124 TaxID=2668071 RepID=UPI00142D0C08|nr:metal ABC transporter permease [Halogeometricum sp. CBA1124]MUV57159.1 iron chelate uptake ABC transporter family permease subunit [Halogeometricum sp. CBA1124]
MLPFAQLGGFVSEMLGYPFMQRAFVAGVCIAVVAPLVGSFLVHRQLAMIGDTLAHTAFAGVAVGIFLGNLLATDVSPYLTALVVAVLAALLIQILSEYTDVYNDVSMAVVLAGGFALGTVLISLTSGGIAVSINQYLFGSLSTLTRGDVELLVVLSALVVAAVLLSYRKLVYVTFDESAARIAGIDVRLLNRLLVVLTAMVVVGAMQMMGVILVAAMLVVPVAAATQLAGSFKQSVAYAVVAAQVAVLSGTTLSYAYGIAAGGTIVLVAIAVYLGAAVAGRLGVVGAG